MAKKEDNALQSAIDAINKDFGAGSLMSFKKGENLEIERISTGSISLDLATGGGYPRGRIIEIYGQESSGKTTLAIHALTEAQKKGLVVAFIDAEHAFDPQYAKDLGLNIETLLFSQPDNGEQGIEIARKLVSTGKVGMIIIDSVTGLTPKSELEGEVGDSKMGLHARLMSRALKMLTPTVKETNTTIIFINQLREKIGVIFGSNEITTGGKSLKFYASIRLDVRRSGQKKDGDIILANTTKVKVVKNKVSPPFKIAFFDIRFGEGIDSYQDVLDFAVDLNIIDKSGSWYSYENTKLGQGASSARSLLIDNPEMYEEIRNKVYKKLEI